VATPVQSKGKNGTEQSGSGHKQRPVWTKKGFPLQVAVFEFSNENAPPSFSVKLTRSFKRQDSGEWETTDYLSAPDLLRAAKLLEAADAFVQNRLEADYQSKRATSEEGRF
jgi:hypothetical protein